MAPLSSLSGVPYRTHPGIEGPFRVSLEDIFDFSDHSPDHFNLVIEKHLLESRLHPSYDEGMNASFRQDIESFLRRDEGRMNNLHRISRIVQIKNENLMGKIEARRDAILKTAYGDSFPILFLK